MVQTSGARFAGCVVGLLFGIGLVRAASAQQAVPARTGFQMALRTGYALPFGKVAANADTTTGGLDLSDAVSGQVPLIVDIGGKLSPHLFLGGYLGLAFGGAGGTTADACEAGNYSCISLGLRLGVELQYHISPSEKSNPWLGYGIGIESTGVGESRDGSNSSLVFGGVEFAHFMAGVDFRLDRVFGLGPFVDFSLGQYSSYSYSADGQPDIDGDIREGALHEWLTLGIRGVFFP